MATILKINMSTTSNVRPLTGYWNHMASVGSDTPGYVLIENIFNSFGVSTGYKLEIVDGFSQLPQERLTNADADYWGWEEEVWDVYWSTQRDLETQLRVSGLPVGTAFSMYIAGEGFNAARDTNFSVTGGDNNPQLYDSTGSTGSPTEPVTLTGTVDATGNIDISMGLVDTTMNINAFVLTLQIPVTTTQTGNIQLDMSVSSDMG